MLQDEPETYIQIRPVYRCRRECREPQHSLEPELQSRLRVRADAKLVSSLGEVFDYLAALGCAPFFTPAGCGLRRFDVADRLRLQTAERLTLDEARQFRPGERKNYINNIFFLQPARTANYPML
jgi:hypothetical protein